MIRGFILISAVLLLPAPVLSDPLVESMEVEIQIQDMSREVYEWAHKRAWDAVKKTTLGRKWEAAEQRAKRASDKASGIMEEWHEAEKQRSDYMLKFGRTRGWSRVKADPVYQELDKRAKNLRAKHKAASAKRPAAESERLYSRLREIAEMFRRKLYLEEMEKRLKKLRMGITEDTFKRLERAYHSYSA